jgi:alpha-amylase
MVIVHLLFVLQNYNDAQQVRFCRLVSLRDLRTSADYVRSMLLGYMNDLVDIGVAGFRVDACKHTMPSDLEYLYGNMHDLPSRWFGSGTRPYVFQEVIYTGGDEPIRPEHYTHLGRVTEFRYSANIGNVFRKWDGQMLRYLENFGEGWNFISGLSALVFIDNHDNQRGHGPGGDSVLTYKDARLYKMATAYELAWAYGQPRVMSSFAFDNTEQGPPSDGNGNTYDVTCFDGSWVCEHRWRQISNMVKFHNAALGQPVSNWVTISDNAIAFGRSGRGFIVINNEDYEVTGTFATGMPDGTYCDVISCENNLPPCDSCRSVTVSGGEAYFSVPNDDDPVVAIHV